jgi:hypothetical protein
MELWGQEQLWSSSTDRMFSCGSLAKGRLLSYFYSINRDRGYSIYEQLEKAGIDPKEYIRFYNLRSYDRINSAGADAGTKASGVNYEAAARAHDEQVGGGIGYGKYDGAGAYGAPIRGDEYERYQQNAPKLGSGGQWDSVSKCVMLGGGDIRQVPWDGDPDKEIDAFVSEELYVHSKVWTPAGTMNFTYTYLQPCYSFSLPMTVSSSWARPI